MKYVCTQMRRAVALLAAVLLLSGDRDPFAKVDLLRREVKSLPNAELVIYPGVGHGLLPVREDAAARIAAFLGGGA